MDDQPCVTQVQNPPPMTDATSEFEYSYKPSLMGAEWTFRLTAYGLQWSIGSVSGEVAYRDIRRLRLSFRPVTMQSYRFLMEIWGERHPKVSIVSTSWKSLTEQERRDDAYTRFVSALHDKIKAAGGTPLLQAGALPLIYWPGAVIFVGVCVATVVLLASALQQGDTAVILFLMAFFGFVVWQLGRFFLRNRPRRYTLDSIPADLLPAPRA